MCAIRSRAQFNGQDCSRIFNITKENTKKHKISLRGGCLEREGNAYSILIKDPNIEELLKMLKIKLNSNDMEYFLIKSS